MGVALSQTSWDRNISSTSSAPKMDQQAQAIAHPSLPESFQNSSRIMYMPENPPDQEFTINLPSVIVRQILSYLLWPDKLNVIKAIPQWDQHLFSVAAWPSFSCANRNRKNMTPVCPNAHAEACACIRKYGQYFQRIRGDFYFFDFSTMGLEILDHVAQYCTSLRALRLDHPVTFKYGSEEVLDKLLFHLRLITHNCKNLSQMAISFHDYMPLDKRTGMDELLLNLNECRERVTLLDFAYGYDTDFTTPPIESLMTFDHLQVLRCPIQVLRTHIIFRLAERRLCELHLVNNDITLNENFKERSEIQWCSLARKFPHLRVHYLVNGRTFRASDLAPNPLLCSLILDSLCNPIDQTLIEAIGNNYGSSLETFAHLCNDWCYQPYEDLSQVAYMYSQLARQCTQLCTFASAVEIPAPAILLLGANRRLQNLWVDLDQIRFDLDVDLTDVWGGPQADEELVDYVDWWEGIVRDKECLNNVVSNFLGFRWKPCSREELDEKVRPLVGV